MPLSALNTSRLRALISMEVAPQCIKSLYHTVGQYLVETAPSEQTAHPGPAEHPEPWSVLLFLPPLSIEPRQQWI